MKNIIILLLFLGGACANHTHAGFNALDVHRHNELSVVKLPVVDVHYVNVIVGNPGKDMRLRIVWGMNTTLVFFDTPEEISKTYGEHPETALVYMGASLVRLSYVVDVSMWDRRVPTRHDGLIGFGEYSDIWRYWSKVTLSSHKLVLGAFDKNVARLNYKPFKLVFTREQPYINIRVHGDNYTLTFDPASKYSYFPHELYRGITTYDLEFGGVHLEIDDHDTKEHLANGFDRTLIRHKTDPNDHLIILGEQFVRSFAYYYDAVTKTGFVMAAHDLFTDDKAQPIYSYFSMMVYFSTSMFWLALVWTHERQEIGPVVAHSGNHPRGSVFSMVEFFVYTASLLMLFTESVAFARYRTMSFYIDRHENISHYVIFCLVMHATIIVGIVFALKNYMTTNQLNFRRIFVETTSFGMFWLTLLYEHSPFAVYIHLIIIAFYAVLRTLQAFMARLTGRHVLFAVALCYTLIGVGFLIDYNILPLVNYYYYGFDDYFYSVLMLLALVYLVPTVVVVVNYPIAELQNGVAEIKEKHS